MFETLDYSLMTSLSKDKLCKLRDKACDHSRQLTVELGECEVYINTLNERILFAK